MPVDVRSWALSSPRKLVLLVGGPILVALLVASFWSARNHGDTVSGSLTKSPSVSAQVPDAQPFVTAAVNFVRVWGRLAPGQSDEDWHAAVRALATPELGKTLDLTETGGLPGASPSGKPQVRFVTTTSALVAVPLDNGHSVLATVVVSGDDWLVDDIQPDVGN